MPEENDDTKPAGKTFSQAELDQVVADRLKRERQKYADYDQLKTKAAAADETAAKSKSETEKLTEQLAKMQDSLDEERRQRHIAEITQAKGLTPAHAKRLTGKTREELEASADELLEDFPLPGKKADDASGDGSGDDAKSENRSDEGSTGKPAPVSKPKENIKPGSGDPDAGAESTDPAKLAAAVQRGI